MFVFTHHTQLEKLHCMINNVNYIKNDFEPGKTTSALDSISIAVRGRLVLGEGVNMIIVHEPKFQRHKKTCNLSE